MCQTAVISKNMVRISKRTYSNRLEVLTPNLYSVRQLARLNRELDGFYELMYSQWRTVTEADYQVFGGQFRLLLETIKGLYEACKKAPKNLGLKEEIRKLAMNYSALREIDANIVNFNINAPKNRELITALEEAGQLMKKI